MSCVIMSGCVHVTCVAVIWAGRLPLRIAHDVQDAGTSRLQHVDNNQPAAIANDPQAPTSPHNQRPAPPRPLSRLASPRPFARLAQQWRGREDRLATDSDARQAYRDAVAAGDLPPEPVWASQAIDLITELSSAADLVAALSAEAEQTLARLGA